MRVCTIISGLPRTYRETYKYFINMINNVDNDVYIFSWQEYYEENVYKTYKPKKITLENYEYFCNNSKNKINFLESLKWDRSQGYSKGHFNLKTGIVSQWYGVRKCFLSIDNINEYDLIVRYRFDWMPLFIINWKELYKICYEENSICYSGMKVHGKEPYRINDMFAIGTPHNMNIYSSLYENITSNNYANAIEKNNCIIPEFLLAYHLSNNNIKTNKIIDYKYKLLK